MKKTISMLLLILAFCASTTVYAWGQREQDALRGIAAGIGAVLLHNHVTQRRVVRYEDDDRVVYRNARPGRGSEHGYNSARSCYRNPYCDNPRLARAYEQGREQRRKEIEAQLEAEAYERGYRENY